MGHNRRDFMKYAAMTALTGAGVAGCDSQNGAEATDTNTELPNKAYTSMTEHFVESDMVSKKPFPLEQARKWAPNADPSDLSTIFPALPGVRPQTELLELAEQHMTQWMEVKTPKSKAMQAEAKKHMPWGVFGTYQKDWETPHLLYAERSFGNKVWDVDGNEYLDVNFGDTPDMFGRVPDNPVYEACAKRMLEDGMSTMMGNQDAIDASKLLADRFGLSHWMHALTASDANRYVLSIARNHTGRSNIAISNFSYHGTIDETQKFMPAPGVISRFHNLPLYHAPVDHGTKIFNWNDLESVEEVLKDETVAIVMMEPVMSNFGWAWPNEDWHSGVKALCEKYGTLLCYDETHTISQGPNGMAGHLNLDYDFWTCGKAISSGIPGAVFGMTEEIATKLEHDQTEVGFFVGAGLGFLGNALCGNTMSTLALKVTLEEIFTEETFKKINSSVAGIVAGMEAINKENNAPFRIETMGNRICYHFIPEAVDNPVAGLIQVGFGGLFELSHAYFWNNGVLIMPYFNMFMITPTHSKEDSEKLLSVWEGFVKLAMKN